MSDFPFPSKPGYISSTKKIYSTIAFGSIFFLLVAWYINGTKDKGLDLFVIVYAVIAIVAAVSAYTVFAIKLRKVRDEKDWDKKLNAYLAAFLIKISILEGAVLLGGAFYFIDVNINILFISVALWGVLLLNRPGRYRIQKDLNLTESQLSALE